MDVKERRREEGARINFPFESWPDSGVRIRCSQPAIDVVIQNRKATRLSLPRCDLSSKFAIASISRVTLYPFGLDPFFSAQIRFHREPDVERC